MRQPSYVCSGFALTGAIDIAQAAAADIPAIGALWTEYWESFGLSPEMQGFAVELASLPGAYAPPSGRLLIATCAGIPAGTAAFRDIGGGSCEMKRLYVRPHFRGAGIARSLIAKLVGEARSAGYGVICCDTLPAMTEALRLYRAFDFVETAPYSSKPTPGAIYLRLGL